jgi:phytochrome-interacting factor 3
MAYLPEWRMLDAVTNTTPAAAVKAKGDSIHHHQRRDHLPDLASVPDQDSLEMVWMENGNVENRHFEMQGVSAEGCNAQQLSYASSWGVGQEIEEDDDGVLPSMAQEMLEVAAANNNNNNSDDDETTTSFVTAAGGHQATSPIINIQDDEMISWLQDPPDDSLDQNYGGDLFGEPPDANIQVFTDTFAGQGITGRSSRMQPTVANSANNSGNHSFMTRAVNAEAAMTLGACRAAGLIRQGAGAEAFSYVRTLKQLGGTRQLPSITPSASVGLTQGLTESQIPRRTSSPNSGPPPPILAPMLLPKSPKLYGGTASNSLPCNNSNQQMQNSGAINFPVFARPAALIKANLQSLNITSILPSNWMRLKLQQGGGGGGGQVNLEASTSASSSITELTTTNGGNGLEPQNGFLAAQSELGMQFEGAGSRSSNLGVDTWSPMSRKKGEQVHAVASAAVGKEAMDCGSEPADQNACCHSNGTTVSAVLAPSDLGVSQSTSISKVVQEPTMISGSRGVEVQASADLGVLQQGTSIPEVQQEPTVTSTLGGSSNVIALDSAKEISMVNKKKKLQAVEEVEYPIGVSVIFQHSDN